MAGGNHPKSSSHKPPPSSALSSYRKSRWESPKNPPSDQKPKPSPNKHSPAQPKSLPAPTHPSFSSHGPPLPYSEPPPPPPAYGFHMLERRTIVLADGSVRSYFALPPDYDFTPRHNSLLRPEFHFSPEAAGFRDRREYINGPGPMKRKFGVDEEKELQHLMSRANSSRDRLVGTSGHFDEETRAAKYMRTTPGAVGPSVVKHKYDEVDHAMLKKVFLHFVKVINENVALRKSYLVEDGKQGRLQCIACRRSSKDFSDMHGLIMHTYNSDNADLRVDHLGLHKALCVLMGWNYSKPPDNSKAYKFLPPDEAAANQDDLIMWPPVVIIHNTLTGKGKDGRMEGLGNKAMDKTIRDLGFGTGKSKSLYGREGHLGITLVKFAGDQSGLKDAVRLAEYFEKDSRGRKVWARVQPLSLGKDDENNPSLVTVDQRTGEKKRILYGYLGTASDLDKVDFETRKKAVIESRREIKASK
ncbi:RNA recognition motif XS domain-containing protein [Citrus sinensis]|uniref:XS domain-containing protein n=2 Tax=Citrus sinensis TaxID=2711 RepID=A0A067GGL4_CITSI|nr:RNA recognition motif XS domain-containing protein [Citrus sinensis]KDO74581.1 hypothetical protein CISIN_1g012147mg [Citrus sinensis]KDO74582.1 hypothetical protein CISIN_1g012147mg [Citrus sinensis]